MKRCCTDTMLAPEYVSGRTKMEPLGWAMRVRTDDPFELGRQSRDGLSSGRSPPFFSGLLTIAAICYIMVVRLS